MNAAPAPEDQPREPRVPRVKVCGVTSVEDALGCVEAGVDLLGVNFIASSPRRVHPADARRITEAVRGRAEVAGVVADEDEAALRRLRDEVGLDWLQLHGDEPPALLDALAPFAFKALRIGDAGDAARAAIYGGAMLLLDARVAGLLGGTGKAVDTALAAPIARLRRVILAGGLRPENVAAAVRAVRPWGVDAASGVESAPGVKDLTKVAAFVEGARSA